MLLVGLLISSDGSDETVGYRFIVSVDDWCDCTGVEHLCVGGCSGGDPKSDGGDPDLAHRKGIKASRNTSAWNSAAVSRHNIAGI